MELELGIDMNSKTLIGAPGNGALDGAVRLISDHDRSSATLRNLPARQWLLALVMLSLCMLTSANGWTQETTDDDIAESTIRLMGIAEASLPDAVTKEIQLPAAVAEDSAAVERAEKGLENANQNRQRREDGLDKADEARERGAEMAEKAQEKRENRGRSGDRPDPPDTPTPQGPPGSN